MSGTSEFLHPERLWWLLAIPFAVLFVSAAGARRRPTVARLVSVLIRSAMLAIAVYALAGPVFIVRSVTPPRLDVIIDASRSVAPQARDQALEKVRTWTREQGLLTRVAAFGERARLVSDWEAAPESAPASRPVAAGDAASDPNPAVALLRLIGRDDGDRAVVMFTDGLVAPPAPFVSAGTGRSALVVPAAAPGGGNARLESIRAARDAAKPEETVLELGGSSSAGAHGVVRVLVDGREERSHPLDLPPGPFRTSVSAGAIPAGRHVVCAWLDGGDAEPLDDELGVVVDVPAPATVMVVAPEGRSLVSSALKAQGIEHVVVSPPDVLQTPAVLDRAQVLVLDRMAVEPLSTPEILGRVSSLLVRGGGVLFIPRENPGELVASPGRKFLDLLPFSGRPLEPKKKEDPKPEKPPPDQEGLKPPDPEKKKIERRPAPTLGLLLVIDCSGSMKGQPLRLVKEAAIAAAEVLHPEDRIGVVAFNDNPTQVVPMTKAGEIDDIRDKISRIVAGGRTDFGPALDEAREIFRNEKVQIKHCIFLTDGHNNWPGAILSRVETMAREGVTLSTVGAGFDVDVSQLSEMAARGSGKYIPAYSADQIPQVVTVEAERIVTASGARKPFEIEAKADEPPTLPPPAPPKPDPPKPELPPEEAPRVATPIRAEWPAAYLKGIHPETTPGIFEWHKVDPAPHGWVSLATKAGEPVAIHTYVGFGRLVALTVPMQGEAPGPLVNWDDYANFASQVVRFLTPATRPERLQLRAEAAGRVARLEVVDVEHKPGIAARLRFAFRDQRARPVAVAVRPAGPGAFELEVPADAGAALIDVAATVEGEGGSGAASFTVGRPPEIERSGPDLEGLERWAGALHGRVSATPPKTLDVAAGESVERRPAPSWWLAILLPLFLLDLALKRAAPGSFI